MFGRPSGPFDHRRGGQDVFEAVDVTDRPHRGVEDRPRRLA